MTVSLGRQGVIFGTGLAGGGNGIEHGGSLSWIIQYVSLVIIFQLLVCVSHSQPIMNFSL